MLHPLDKLPPRSYTILSPLAAQLLHHFTTSQQITPPPTLTPFYPSWQPNSYIILPSLDKYTPSLLHHFTPLAAQLLHHFTPSEQITPSLLHHFTPLAAQPLHHFTPSVEITPLLLHHFTPLGSPTLTSFFPPLNKLPTHSYIILPPLAAQILALVTPSGQITPSLLHHFITLGSPTITSFYRLWTNYPLTLTPFYTFWQPNSYIILPPLNNLPPNSYIILSPLAAQLLYHFTHSEQITPSLL